MGMEPGEVGQARHLAQQERAPVGKLALELVEVGTQLEQLSGDDHPRLREVLDKHWTGPKARHAFQLAATRFEPTVRRIGDLLFGTREGGITPEFARVLRNQILGKDRRWFVLDNSFEDNESMPNAGELKLRVCRGDTPAANPFLPVKSRPYDVRDR